MACFLKAFGSVSFRHWIPCGGEILIIVHARIMIRVFACTLIIGHACSMIIVHACIMIVVHVCTAIIVYACTKIKTCELHKMTYRSMKVDVVLLLLELLHHLPVISSGEELAFPWCPLATPGFNIGFIHCLEKFGTFLELLHHLLVPNFKRTQILTTRFQY